MSLTKGGPPASMTSSTASQSSVVESQGSAPKILSKLDFSGLVDLETDGKESTIEQEKLEAASPFLGIYLNKIRCKKCLESVNRFENGCCLTLPIINRPGYRFAFLEDCLKEYFAKETVGDYSCKRCGMLEVIHELSQEIEALRSQPHISRFACQLRPQLQFEGRQEVDTDVIERALRKQKQFMMNAYKRGLEPQQFQQSFRLFKQKQINQKQRAYLFDIPQIRCPITKSISLVKPPEILVIHLQRLTYSNTGYLVKNNQFVQFDTSLNLAPYFQNFYPSEKTKYNLIGAIEHIGPAHFGHYISFRKAFPQKTEEEQQGKNLKKNKKTHEPQSVRELKATLDNIKLEQSKLVMKLDESILGDEESKKSLLRNLEIIQIDKELDQSEKETQAEKRERNKKRSEQQELWVKCDDAKVEGIEKRELLDRPAYMLFYQRERV